MKICVLIPYYGKEPKYFNFWKLTASYNNNIDFFFITDIDMVSDISNIRIIKYSFDDIKRKIKGLLGNWAIIDTPYKLCDYKPVYAKLFEELIVGYDFWGYCDVDLIFGKMSNWITEDILSKYDKLYFEGHFTLYRNTEEMNSLYAKKKEGYLDYKTAFSTKYVCHFDEAGIVAFSRDFNIKTYIKKDYCDINSKYYHFSIDEKEDKFAFAWQKGNLYQIRCEAGKIIKYPVLYAHFQKRYLDVKIDDFSEEFYIIPNCFFDRSSMEQYLLGQAGEIEQEEAYKKSWNKKFRKMRIENMLKGAIIFRILKKRNKWKSIHWTIFNEDVI